MGVGKQPFGEKKVIEIKGRRMAYVDKGVGDPIVFQHGNPTSSYLWRNIMPHCVGLGRLIACDLIGMGDSDKLEPSGPERYSYAEHRDHLDSLWEALDLGDRVVLVLHDWGSALGFDWANRHRERVQGIAYMEAITMPIEWEDFPDGFRDLFQAFRSPAGEHLVLQDNVFVEQVLPGAILRPMSEGDMAAYRMPFLNVGEDRRPTLSWPRQIPIAGEPANVVAIARDYADWLSESPVPKLFVNAEPGALTVGRMRDFCRTWPNQAEITVAGAHFIQEDSPDEIGTAIAAFVRRLRQS